MKDCKCWCHQNTSNVHSCLHCNTIKEALWEKEFDKNWMDIRAGNPAFDWRILNKDIKDFIRNLLSTLERQVREGTIEEIREEVEKYKCDFNWDFKKNKAKHKSYIAIDDILSSLPQQTEGDIKK